MVFWQPNQEISYTMSKSLPFFGRTILFVSKEYISFPEMCHGCEIRVKLTGKKYCGVCSKKSKNSIPQRAIKTN